jgi:hypothetical protein
MDVWRERMDADEALGPGHYCKHCRPGGGALAARLGSEQNALCF